MDDEKIERARELMAVGRYDAAGRILKDISDNPMAIGLLSTIEQMAPASKRKNDDVDLYRQDEAMHYKKPMDKVPVVHRGTHREPRNYIIMAFIVLGAYWFMWPVGLGFNIYFLREARELKKLRGDEIDTAGVGCLWSLIILQVVGLVLLVIFLFVVVTALSSPAPY